MVRIALLLLAGLILPTAGGLSAAGTISEHTTHRLHLSPATPIRIRATVGDVTVVGWPHPETTIDIERTAPTGEQLTLIDDLVHDDGSELLISAVQMNDGKDTGRRGSVTIHTPAAQRIDAIDLFEGKVALTGLTGGVRATVAHGSINAISMSGSIRLETTIGAINLHYADSDLSGPLRLRTFNGDIRVHLATAPLNARILALSLGGTITSDIPLMMKTGYGPRFGETTIGFGHPVVSIDAVNGNIRLASAR